MKRVFVSGPPGSGKTYLGHDLQARYGWTHFDCEDYYKGSDEQVFKDFLHNPVSHLPEAKNLVVTWGFLPSDIGTVRILKSNGFKTVWLTADLNKLITVVIRRAEEEKTLNYNYFNPRHWAHEMNRVAASSKRLLKPDYTITTLDKHGHRIDAAPVLINLTEGEQCLHLPFSNG